MKSVYFDMVKRFYDAGYPQYTNEGLKGFVVTKMITAEEYQVITGVKYEAVTA